MEQLELTSREYSGDLTVDSSFFNLREIDISNSAISLTVNDNDVVQKINLNNIDSNGVKLTNNNSLSEVTFNNATVDTFEISPLWTPNLELTNSHKIKNLTVNGLGGTLSIQNNAIIQTLGFQKFATLNINNCVQLSKISCNESEPTLKTVSITNCPSLTSLKILIDNITTINLSGCTNLSEITFIGSNFDNLTALNLSQTKITKIKFASSTNEEGTSKDYLDLYDFKNLAVQKDNPNSYFNISNNPEIEYIQFRNEDDPIYLKHNFENCTKLKRVYGNLVVCTTNCFSGLTSFSVHGPDYTDK